MSHDNVGVVSSAPGRLLAPGCGGDDRAARPRRPVRACPHAGAPATGSTSVMRACVEYLEDVAATWERLDVIVAGVPPRGRLRARRSAASTRRATVRWRTTRRPSSGGSNGAGWCGGRCSGTGTRRSKRWGSTCRCRSGVAVSGSVSAGRSGSTGSRCVLCRRPRVALRRDIRPALRLVGPARRRWCC